MEGSAPSSAPRTLGDVLYARPLWPLPAEEGWRDLVADTARGNVGALYELYERTHRVAFTLVLRLTCDREVAEQVTAEVYARILQQAAEYRAGEGTVVAWIMNIARSAAISRLRQQQTHNRGEPAGAGLISIDMPDYRHLLHFREQGRLMRSAVAGITTRERKVIEATYFASLDYERAAAALQMPVGSVTAAMRSAMHHLARALGRGTELSDERIFARNCEYAERSCAHLLGAAPVRERERIALHVAICSQCRNEADALRPILESFIAWPTDLLRPRETLREELERRIAAQVGHAAPFPASSWVEPFWESVAPAISCKLLSKDSRSGMVSMLVRLEPAGEYPPHTHAAHEELHLLDGELWIDERKLHAGDYNRAEAGTADRRVWSETGCTCVLVTSAHDILA